MFYCTFHRDVMLKGLDVYQITLGDASILVCSDCAQAFRNGDCVLSGL